MSFIETVSRIGMAIDGMGVAVIMLGAVVSSGSSSPTCRAGRTAPIGSPGKISGDPS
ncbi:hypothetical protein I551_2192 [Mycobacterium ulcerans str. Harvey]|uniref:Uncharacterized protein n=1 Tax=Mycobacterium ulcerans str. Harvey TaxID=1299332 RepID=A0ABP3AJF5_MYCUL|nr:hypothetical protein I551_2192 [Mycobacterium ulcerans str. Harvey]